MQPPESVTFASPQGLPTKEIQYATPVLSLPLCTDRFLKFGGVFFFKKKKHWEFFQFIHLSALFSN